MNDNRDLTFRDLIDAMNSNGTADELKELHSDVGYVYFLCDAADIIIYVGKSRVLTARIEQHRKSLDLKFERVFYIEVPLRDLEKVEAVYIAAFYRQSKNIKVDHTKLEEFGPEPEPPRRPSRGRKR